MNTIQEQIIGSSPVTNENRVADEGASICWRHLRFGWWSLLIFLSLGLMLEVLHGFKLGWYLSIATETRRLLWTLAHAHGTLLALLNIAFALTVPKLSSWSARPRRHASACLMAATVLLPSGFFVGGIVLYGGDPGLGILLVPLGGLLLFMAVFLTASAFKSQET